MDERGTEDTEEDRAAGLVWLQGDVTVSAVVGYRINMWRKLARLSQEELGRRLAPYLGGEGWSKQMVSAVERGRRDLSATELLAFAAVLECSVFDLFKPRRPSDEVKFPGGASMSAARVRRTLQELSGHEQLAHEMRGDIENVRTWLEVLESHLASLRSGEES